MRQFITFAKCQFECSPKAIQLLNSEATNATINVFSLSAFSFYLAPPSPQVLLLSCKPPDSCWNVWGWLKSHLRTLARQTSWISEFTPTIKARRGKPKLNTSAAKTINIRVSDETDRRGVVQHTHTHSEAIFTAKTLQEMTDNGARTLHAQKADDLPSQLQTLLCPARSCREANERMVNWSQRGQIRVQVKAFSCSGSGLCFTASSVLKQLSRVNSLHYTVPWRPHAAVRTGLFLRFMAAGSVQQRVHSWNSSLREQQNSVLRILSFSRTPRVFVAHVNIRWDNNPDADKSVKKTLLTRLRQGVLVML